MVTEGVKVLFVGNSYTLYNDVPAQVQRLGRDAGISIDVVTEAEGGASLEAHEARAATRAALTAGDFTHLVLQEQSTRPLHDRALFLGSLQRLSQLAGDCKLVLYQTWARQAGHAVYRSRWSGGSPEGMLDGLVEAYDEAGDTLREQGRDVSVAAVGTAWAGSLSRHPALELHDTDGHHASAAGSHLAALVITAALSSAQEAALSCYTPDGLESHQATQLRRALTP